MSFELKINYGHSGAVGSIVLEEIGGQFYERLAVGFRKSGELLEDQIKSHLQGPGRGPAPSRRSREIFRERRARAAHFGITGRKAEPFTRLNNFPGTVTGALRRSVKFKVRGSGTSLGLVVGPNRVYAARLEFGYEGTQTVTQRQRRYLHAIGIHLRKETVTIRSITPAYPFVWPAYEKRRQDVVDTIGEELLNNG